MTLEYVGILDRLYRRWQNETNPLMKTVRFKEYAQAIAALDWAKRREAKRTEAA